MAIISQQTWNKFTEEEKEKIKEYYDIYSNEVENDSEISVANGQKHLLEGLFDKENLQSKSKIRTWEDVEEEYPEYAYDINDLTKITYIDMRILCNLIATYKISKLIEFGYGGNITDEEWENVNKSKWVINCDMSKEDKFEILELFVDKFFIAFHEESQAEEFMSYEENRELLRQYYML